MARAQRKYTTIAWAIMTVFFAIWWVVVYGILGHVCPFSFWSLVPVGFLGAYVVTLRRPKWWVPLLSFLIASGGWITAWFLHGDYEERHVTLAPHLIFIITAFVILSFNIFMARKHFDTRPTPQWQLDLSAKFVPVFAVIELVVGFGYIFLPQVKDWLRQGSDGSEWFDTRFYGWDLYWLFLIAALMAIVGGIAAIGSLLLRRKGVEGDLVNALEFLRLLLLIFVIVGLFPLYHLMGRALHEQKTHPGEPVDQ